jgi:hypothetical protein
VFLAVDSVLANYPKDVCAAAPTTTDCDFRFGVGQGWSIPAAALIQPCAQMAVTGGLQSIPLSGGGNALVVLAPDALSVGSVQQMLPLCQFADDLASWSYVCTAYQADLDQQRAVGLIKQGTGDYNQLMLATKYLAPGFWPTYFEGKAAPGTSVAYSNPYAYVGSGGVTKTLTCATGVAFGVSVGGVNACVPCDDKTVASDQVCRVFTGDATKNFIKCGTGTADTVQSVCQACPASSATAKALTSSDKTYSQLPLQSLRDDIGWNCRYNCSAGYVPNLKDGSAPVAYSTYKANPCVACPFGADYVCPVGQYRLSQQSCPGGIAIPTAPCASCPAVVNVNNQIKATGVVCPAMCITGYIARLEDGSLNASVVPQSRIRSCVRCNASMACGGTCPNGTYETGGGMCAPCTTKCPLGFYPAGCRGTTDAVCISCGSLQNPSATSNQSSNRTGIQDTALTNTMRWLPWRDSYAGLSAAALLRTTGATCNPATRCCRACRSQRALW